MNVIFDQILSEIRRDVQVECEKWRRMRRLSLGGWTVYAGPEVREAQTNSESNHMHCFRLMSVCYRLPIRKEPGMMPRTEPTSP